MIKKIVCVALLLTANVNGSDYLKAVGDKYVIGIDRSLEYRVNDSIVDETDSPNDVYSPSLAAYPTMGSVTSTPGYDILSYFDTAQENGTNYITAHSSAGVQWDPLNSSTWTLDPRIKVTTDVDLFGEAQTVGRAGSGTSKSHGSIYYRVKRSNSTDSGYVKADFVLTGNASEVAGTIYGSFKIAAVFGDNSITATYDAEKKKWYITRQLRNSTGSWTHNNVTETINSQSFSITNEGYTFVHYSNEIPFYCYVSDYTDPRSNRIVGSSNYIDGGVNRAPSAPAGVLSIGVDASAEMTLDAQVKMQ